jgi:hypothetical protein
LIGSAAAYRRASVVDLVWQVRDKFLRSVREISETPVMTVVFATGELSSSSSPFPQTTEPVAADTGVQQ